MSRNGNPYDNAMAENFFSLLKTECIYRHKPATFSEANEMVDRYIRFYNYERIQLKIGGRLLYCVLVGYIWYEAPAEEMNFITLLEFINASEACEDDEE